jgi:hypothetical protein
VLARWLVTWWVLRVGTAAALGIDAAVHLRNAAAYDDVKATSTQGGEVQHPFGGDSSATW